MHIVLFFGKIIKNIKRLSAATQCNDYVSCSIKEENDKLNKRNIFCLSIKPCQFLLEEKYKIMKTIFVSSTFKDFQNERDVLHSKVLPLLNEEAIKFGEAVNFCDLRWGVDTSKNSEEEINEKVLSVCLKEIDRAKPYMIVLLGERYGYMPGADEINNVAKRADIELQDLEISITNLEIEYGSLSRKNGLENTWFFFRTIHNFFKPSEYNSEGRIQKQKLEELKNRIKRLAGDHAIFYDTSIKDNKLQNMDAFSEKVINVLKMKFEIEWKEYAALNRYEKENRIQWNYIYNKDLVFSTRGDFVNEICEGIKQNHEALYVLRSESGSGKSTLFCHACLQFRKDGWTVVPVSCGSTINTTTSHDILLFLIKTMEKLCHTELKDSDIDSFGTNKLRDYLTSLCVQYASIEGNHLLIAIDALDQINPDDNRDRLQFLPINREAKFRVFCTCLPEFNAINNAYILPVPNLKEAEIRDMIKGILAENGKEVADQVVNHMVEKREAKNPLYLYLMVARLMLLNRDDFHNIALLGDDNTAIYKYEYQLIDKLPEELEQLAVHVLRQAGKDVDSEMVSDMLEYMAASRHGLRMEDLRVILNEKYIFNDLKFARFINYISDVFFIRVDGRVDFLHKVFRNGILKEIKDIKSIHETIFAYLKKLSYEDLVRKQEITYHCIQTKDTRKYINLINEYEKYLSSQANNEKVIALENWNKKRFYSYAAKDTYNAIIEDDGKYFTDVLNTSTDYTIELDETTKKQLDVNRDFKIHLNNEIINVYTFFSIYVLEFVGSSKKEIDSILNIFQLWMKKIGGNENYYSSSKFDLMMSNGNYNISRVTDRFIEREYIQMAVRYALLAVVYLQKQVYIKKNWDAISAAGYQKSFTILMFEYYLNAAEHLEKIENQNQMNLLKKYIDVCSCYISYYWPLAFLGVGGDEYHEKYDVYYSKKEYGGYSSTRFMTAEFATAIIKAKTCLKYGDARSAIDSLDHVYKEMTLFEQMRPYSNGNGIFSTETVDLDLNCGKCSSLLYEAYCINGDHDKAEESIRNAVKSYQKVIDKGYTFDAAHNFAVAYSSMAEMCVENGYLDEAEQSLIFADKEFNNISNIYHYDSYTYDMICLSIIYGDYYRKKMPENLETSTEYYEKALQYFEKDCQDTGILIKAISLYQKLAQNRFDERKFKESLEVIEKVINITLNSAKGSYNALLQKYLMDFYQFEILLKKKISKSNLPPVAELRQNALNAKARQEYLNEYNHEDFASIPCVQLFSTPQWYDRQYVSDQWSTKFDSVTSTVQMIEKKLEIYKDNIIHDQSSDEFDMRVTEGLAIILFEKFGDATELPVNEEFLCAASQIIVFFNLNLTDQVKKLYSEHANQVILNSHKKEIHEYWLQQYHLLTVNDTGTIKIDSTLPEVINSIDMQRQCGIIHNNLLQRDLANIITAIFKSNLIAITTIENQSKESQIIPYSKSLNYAYVAQKKNEQIYLNVYWSMNDIKSQLAFTNRTLVAVCGLDLYELVKNTNTVGAYLITNNISLYITYDQLKLAELLLSK